MSDLSIKFENVSKSYEHLNIIKNLNLEITKGEFVTVIGSSGSGKTTVLKMINGLLKPTSGAVFVNDEDVANVDLITLRRQIGYAIQGTGLFPHLNVKKNMAYVLNLQGIKQSEIDSRVIELADIVSLSPDLLNRYPMELSGGERQRVGIARALAAKPEILLMDEPFGAVDEITRQVLQDEIKKIHKELKVTVVFITHDISEALKLGTKIVVMDRGEIVQIGTPQELITAPKTEFVKALVGQYLARVELTVADA